MTRLVSESLREFLGAYPPEIEDTYLKTRDAVLARTPQANELIYDAYNALSCVYSYTESIKQGFIHIAAYPKHVNLGFNQGATLPDPKSKLQGNGARIRHIKVSHIDDLKNEDTLDLIDAAILQGEQMLADIPGATMSSGGSIVKSVSENKRRP